MNEYLITKLKEGRTNKGLKQSDVATQIGVKGNTLSNYENGVSEPDIDTFCALCDIYELDAAELLGEAYGLGVQGSDFSIKPSEIEYIKKYRDLDDHGKKMVDYTLEKEWERSKKGVSDYEKYRNALKFYNDAISNKKDLTVDDLVCPFPDETAPPKTVSELADELIKAAHSISGTSDDDIKHDFSIMKADEF